MSIACRRFGGLIAVITVMSLPACGDEQPAALRQQAVAPASAPPAALRAGPHGAYDPHGGLGPDKLLQVALQHLAEGRETEAMDVLNRAIPRYADDSQLLALRGSLLLERGRSAAALADLEAGVRLRPADPLLHTNRAQAYRRFGRVEEAMADLDKAIELDPNLMAARFNRGAIQAARGEYAEALADFNQCVRIDPQAAAPYFNRAAAQEALGDRDAAVADLRRFIDRAQSESWKQTARDLLQRWEQDKGSGGDGDRR